MERDNKQSGCCTFNAPCAKFIVSTIITLASLSFGAFMLIYMPTGSMAPFYSGLVTSSVAFWLTPPKVYDD